jgi:hypothetical protein
VQLGPGVHHVHFAFEPLAGAWEQVRKEIIGVP